MAPAKNATCSIARILDQRATPRLAALDYAGGPGHASAPPPAERRRIEVLPMETVIRALSKITLRLHSSGRSSARAADLLSAPLGCDAGEELPQAEGHRAQRDLDQRAVDDPASPRRLGAVGAIDPGGRDAVLYVHGSGFEIGARRDVRRLASWIASVTGADVYLPEYRLAPDIRSRADRRLRRLPGDARTRSRPHRTAVIGDSAGWRDLRFDRAIAARDGAPRRLRSSSSRPGSACRSPAPSSGWSARRDPMLRREWLRARRPQLRRRAPSRRPADLAAVRICTGCRRPRPGRHRRDPPRRRDPLRRARRTPPASTSSCSASRGCSTTSRSSAAAALGARGALVDIAAFLARRFERGASGDRGRCGSPAGVIPA